MASGNSLLQSIGSAVSAALQSPAFQNPAIQPRYPHGTGGTGDMATALQAALPVINNFASAGRIIMMQLARATAAYIFYDGFGIQIVLCVVGVGQGPGRGRV